MRMKNLDPKKLIKSALRAMPDNRFIARRRRSTIVPLILGAIGVAVFGGIAAVMIFSPRTRHRALGMAKDRYGRVRGQIGQMDVPGKLGLRKGRAERIQQLEDGVAPESGGGELSGTGAV
jgi:hypothetical protein